MLGLGVAVTTALTSLGPVRVMNPGLLDGAGEILVAAANIGMSSCPSAR